VNEAMCFALPMIIPHRVGTAEDLVRPCWNGVAVAHQGVEELAQAAGVPAVDTDPHRSFGELSQRPIDDYSSKRYADDIVMACLTSIEAT
jgi:hypothetical protein